MNDDIINLESRLVFRDVSKLTAGGMSTAAALAHAAHEAAERKAKMTTGFAQDDYIRSLEEQIATLQSDLAAAKESAKEKLSSLADDADRQLAQAMAIVRKQGDELKEVKSELAAAKAELTRAPVKVGYVKKSDAKYMPQINQEMVLIVKGLSLLCPENGYQPIYIDPPECNASHKGEEG